MALNREKEAVWIDDGVWDMNGVLVGWIDGTDDVPADKNFEAKYLVYKEPVDSNRSWIFKLLGGLKKAWFRLNGDKKSAKQAGFNVSPEPIPKPAIRGFPSGMTVDGIQKSGSSPEKRVVVEEDMYGNSPYSDKVWGTDSSGKSVTELKDRIQELEQRLQAEEGKSEELSEELDREENSGGRGRHSDLYPEEDYPMEDEY